MDRQQARTAGIVAMVLVLATLAVYWPVGGHAFLSYDDNVYIYRNPRVIQGLTRDGLIWAFTSVEYCNWHPVTWLSHMLDVQLFGLAPRGHHLTNLSIHCACTLLLFRLLLRLTGRLWPAAVTAALFALHPLNVESVAWAAERKNVLSTCFAFLALHFYTRYATAPAGDRSRSCWYWCALVAFLLGLMAKPMLVTLPALLLLLDFWPLGRFTVVPLHRLLREKLPFAFLSLLSALITIHAQQSGGAVVALDAIPLAARLQNALVATVLYLRKLLWPSDLGVLYPFRLPIPLWQVLGAALLLLGISLTALHLRRRHPSLLFGWCWFIVTLVPVIGLVQVGNQAMADRYGYLTTVGLFIALAWGGAAAAAEHRRRLLIALLTVGAIGGAALATRHQLGYWSDNITLYRHTLQVAGGSSVIHYNLGMAYGQAGDRKRAVAEFRAALRYRPDDPLVRTTLASTLAEEGDIEGALAEFRRALALRPQDPAARYGYDYWSQQRGTGAVR